MTDIETETDRVHLRGTQPQGQGDGTIYVHANKTNLVRHIEWRLENDK